jgi:hypothetical protein
MMQIYALCCGLPEDVPTNRLRPVSINNRHPKRIPQAPISTHTTWSAMTNRCKQARPGTLWNNATTAGQASRRSWYARHACSVLRGTSSPLAA